MSSSSSKNLNCYLAHLCKLPMRNNATYFKTIQNVCTIGRFLADGSYGGIGFQLVASMERGRYYIFYCFLAIAQYSQQIFVRLQEKCVLRLKCIADY